MNINAVEIFASFMVLFAIIDILGSIPIILDLKAKTGKINAEKVSLVALSIMLGFLFIGAPLLGVFGVDVSSFARWIIYSIPDWSGNDSWYRII